MSHQYVSLPGNLQDGIGLFPVGDLDRLDEIVDRYAGQSQYLIPALKDAQEMFGCLPVEIQDRLADGFGITPSRVYGVVTFYSFFTVVPRGRHTVRLCLGTACYVRRSREILESITNTVGVNVGETSRDGRYTIEAVRCLGTCGLAPAMMVGQETYGNMNPGKALEILESCK